MPIIETKGKILLTGIAVILIITIGAFLSKSKENNLPEQIVTEQNNVPSPSPSTINEQPYAWIGEAYPGKIGEPIQFDASGSYDPSGLPIALYEWDFNADGVFEYQTSNPTATHIYDNEFNDFVVARVTGSGGTATAKARAVVNSQGYAPQGNGEPCELDENGFSIFIDEEGLFLPCTVTNLPTTDKPGVTESRGAPVDSK